MVPFAKPPYLLPESNHKMCALNADTTSSHEAQHKQQYHTSLEGWRMIMGSADRAYDQIDKKPKYGIRQVSHRATRVMKRYHGMLCKHQHPMPVLGCAISYHNVLHTIDEQVCWHA